MSIVLVIGGIAKMVYDMNVSSKNDEKASRLRMEAADRMAQATADVDEIKNKLERAQDKLSDRKKSVANYIFPEFKEVYSKICKVNCDLDERKIAQSFNPSDLIAVKKEFVAISEINCHSMTSSQMLSNALLEGFKGLLLGGVFAAGLSSVTGSIKKESEINLNDAYEFKRSAEIYEESASKQIKAYATLIWQLEALSNFIASLNGFMLRVCRYSDELIDQKGYDSRNYTDKELEYMRSCINIAQALKECFLTPVFHNNELTKAAFDLINLSERCINQFSEALKNL